MEETLNKGKLVLLVGSALALIFGLLAAFAPGLAYIRVLTNLAFLPPESSVDFYPFAFGVHMFTLKLVLCAIGGAIGLFSVLEKSKRRYMNFAAILVIAFGLALPAVTPVKELVAIPEYRSFIVPWIGFLLVLTGVIVMFLALTLKNPKVPQIALASVPLMLISYGLSPTLVLINYFPRFIFEGMFSMGSVLIGTLTLAGCLLMVWGAYKAAKSSNFPAKTL